MAEATPLKLTNPETAALFECTRTTDVRVQVTGGGYKGLLSNITPAAAAVMVDEHKHPALVRKATTTKASPNKEK